MAASWFSEPPQSSADGDALAARAAAAIPGGCHTYAKAEDQYPVDAPRFIVRGRGCRVWDTDGREFIEYASGLRAVTLGHAFEPVLEAVRRQLELGTNFNRPSPLEVECAEEFLGLIGTDMVKFAKDGSTALDAAVKLARAVTGRDMVAICADHPFFSSSDWFIGTTPMAAGVPDAIRRLTVKFPYNDLDGVRALFDAHPGRIACAVLEPARTELPRDGFLERLATLCRERGALLVFGEMMTGFRWHRGGGQALFGVRPDLSAFGKAMANGFALSALTGRREWMSRGGLYPAEERVFLLSTTHGAETHALAAGLATMRWYRDHPVVETLAARGARLRAGVVEAARRHGVDRHFELIGPDCALLYATRDAEGRPSQAFRTLFLQQTLARGILAPSFVVGASHGEADVDETIEAVDATLAVYAHALESGVERFVTGRPVRPLMTPRA